MLNVNIIAVSTENVENRHPNPNAVWHSPNLFSYGRKYQTNLHKTKINLSKKKSFFSLDRKIKIIIISQQTTIQLRQQHEQQKNETKLNCLWFVIIYRNEIVLYAVQNTDTQYFMVHLHYMIVVCDFQYMGNCEYFHSLVFTIFFFTLVYIP